MADFTNLEQFITFPSDSNDDFCQEDESSQNIEVPVNCQRSGTVQNIAGFKLKDECEQYLESEEENDSVPNTFLDSKEGSTLVALFREFLDYLGLKFTISAYEAEIEVGKYYEYSGRTKLANDLRLDPDAEGPLIAQVLPESIVCPSVGDLEAPSNCLSANRLMKEEPRPTSYDYEDIALKTEDTDLEEELPIIESEHDVDFIKQDPLAADYDPPKSYRKTLPCTSGSYNQLSKRLRVEDNPTSDKLSSILRASSSASTTFPSRQCGGFTSSDQNIEQASDEVDFSDDEPEVVSDSDCNAELVTYSSEFAHEPNTEAKENCSVDDVIWIDEETLSEPEAGSSKNEVVGSGREVVTHIENQEPLESRSSSSLEFQDFTNSTGGEENQPVITCVFSQGTAPSLHSQESNDVTSEGLLKSRKTSGKHNAIKKSVRRNNKTISSSPRKRYVSRFKTKLPQQKKILVCDLCNNIRFTNKESFIRHVRQKHFNNINNFNNIQKYVCKFCNKHLLTKDRLEDHVTRVHKSSFFCEVCKKGFGRETELIAHMTYFHPTTELFECKICCIYFTKEATLLEHQRNGRHGVQLLEID